MALPNVETVIKDSEFLGLPALEKQKVLQSIDPDYARLPEVEQKKVLLGIGSVTGRPLDETDRNTPEWAGKYPNLYGLLGASKEIARFAGETAGMVGGGMLGGVGGAALGYGGVKAFERFLEGEKATIPEAALTTTKDVGTGFGAEIGGHVAGKYLGGMLEKISRPGVGRLISREEIVQRIKAAESLGVTLSPAEATGSKSLSLYESMLDKSPFSTTIINEWRELRQLKPIIAMREKALESGNLKEVDVLGANIKNQVEQFVDRLRVVDEAKRQALKQRTLEKFGVTDSMEDLGKSAQEIIGKRSAEAVAKKNAVYAEMADFIPQENMATPTLASTAKKNLEQLSQLPNQDATLMKTLKWASDSDIEKRATLDSIAAYPPAVQKQIMEKNGIAGDVLVERDWGTLQRFRTQLNDLIRQNDLAIKSGNPSLKGQTTNEGRIYGELKAALDKDLEGAAKKTGGEAWDRYQAANAFYKDEYAPIWKQAGIIRKVAFSNPGAVADVVLQPRNVLEVETLRKAMGEQAFNETVKPAITNKLLGKSDIFDPKELAASLEKYGDEVIGKIYAPGEIAFLKDIAKGGGFNLNEVIPAGMKSLVNEISKRSPETVADVVLTAWDKTPNTPRLVENILKIRTMVDKETFEGIKAEFASRLFQENPITKYIQPERLSRHIQKLEPALKLLYSPEQVSWLNKVAETGRLMAMAEKSAANSSGTAMNVVTWGTFGAILNSPIQGIGTGVIAPKFMANIYLSDAGRRYFTEGLKTPLGTKRGTEIATKLAEIAGMDLYESENK